LPTLVTLVLAAGVGVILVLAKVGTG
jgi:hypothetical protein